MASVNREDDELAAEESLESGRVDGSDQSGGGAVLWAREWRRARGRHGLPMRSGDDRGSVPLAKAVTASAMSWQKRVFDVVVAAAGLVVLSPLFALVAVAIRVDDPGPVFFRHTRVGRGGERFRMWKFRTMTVDAERRGGPLTVGSDPRITRMGRVLRARKLDELPQLLNVLSGRMSLVGPRPESPKYVELYDGEQRPVLELTPGITDPAAIRYSDLPTLLDRASDPEQFYVEQIMPDKIRLHLSYASRATFVSDLRVLGQTVRCLVGIRSGAGDATADPNVWCTPRS